MILGLVLLVVCHVLTAVITSLIGLVFLGALQLLYVVPVCFAARRAKRNGIATGMVIGAAVTLLLNAACWGMQLYK